MRLAAVFALISAGIGLAAECVRDVGEVPETFVRARSLIDHDTPKAAEMLKGIAAGYPLAYVSLAEIYKFGNFADRAKAREAIGSFYAACPGSLDAQALRLLRDFATAEMAVAAAPVLRSRLEKGVEAGQVETWDTLWNLEFKARPVPEHADVRRQILEDVKAITAVQDKPPVAVLVTLRNGYRYAQDTAAVERMEGRIAAEYPSSQAALTIAQSKWDREHPPLPGTPSMAQMEAHLKAELTFAEEQARRAPDDAQAQVHRLLALRGTQDASTERFLAAADEVMRAVRVNPESAYGLLPPQLQVARVYAARGVRLDQVETLVAEGLKTIKEHPRPNVDSDRYPKAEAAEIDRMRKTQIAQILLDLATKTGKPEVARSAVEALKDVRTERPRAIAETWSVRAKFAELEHRRLDALMLYREAMTVSPGAFYTRNFDRLWAALGGTAEGRELISKSAETKVKEALVRTEWKRPGKALPPFALQDLEGQTWKLSSFEGKTLLVNLWATWCDPCRREHPHLQKLYEKLKARSDVEVITLNVDDGVDRVAPYMKEHGYTFPVLLAKPYVEDVLPESSIPRNWIVDARGKWLWEQVGFGGDPAKWEADLMKLLDAR